jgi:hypothetical protein
MRKLLFWLILISIPVGVFSQTFGKINTRLTEGLYSLQFSYQEGGVFDTNDFVAGDNAAGMPINHHQALSIRLAKQTTGIKAWEQVYSYPRYGVGIFMADFRSRELGQPISCFGFLTGPFFRTGPFSLNYDLAIGLAFHWNKYDPIANPYNKAIGSTINSHIEAGIGAELEMSKRLTAGAGFGVTHFSNGGITPPNRGINTSFWKFNLRYELYHQGTIRPRQLIEKIKILDEWVVAGYTGFKNMEIPVSIEPGMRTPTIPVYACGLIGTYHRRINYKSKFGAGMVIGYNGIINPQYENVGDTVYLIRKPDIRRIEVSVFPSYELVFNKLTLLIQAGFYLYRPELIRSSPVFYQRLGVRYDLTDHYFVALQLRARSFDTAEIIEWTLGYRF